VLAHIKVGRVVLFRREDIDAISVDSWSRQLVASQEEAVTRSAGVWSIGVVAGESTAKKAYAGKRATSNREDSRFIAGPHEGFARHFENEHG